MAETALDRTETARGRGEKVTFSFGKNWQRFVERALNPERERIAIKSLTEFLELSDLQGRSFLDVGPFSVRSCEELRRRAGNPEHWQVLQGSILDDSWIAGLEKADIVYAWGSLHHTGNMWKAIRNASSRVEVNGLFYLSIYNKVYWRKGSEFWLKVKKLYNRSSRPGKFLLEVTHFVRNGLLRKLASFENPISLFTEYSQGRGMSYWTDVRDWLGGYPYEFASADEIFRFCTRDLGMEMVNLRVTNTLGTNEFLFRRKS